MCGRYRLKKNIEALLAAKEFKDLVISPKVRLARHRFNIGPGQQAPVVLRQQGKLVLDELLWRQPPFYLARAEGIQQTRSYKRPFETQRCLIPMHGFYEWDERVKPKQPWHFQYQNEDLLMIAGIWDWEEKNDEPAFTLITTAANEAVYQAHHRMPVILPRQYWAAWLDQVSPAREMASWLVPYPDASRIKGWPVSLKVNNWRNDDETLIAPFVPPSAAQTELSLEF